MLVFSAVYACPLLFFAKVAKRETRVFGSKKALLLFACSKELVTLNVCFGQSCQKARHRKENPLPAHHDNFEQNDARTNSLWTACPNP